MTTTISLLMVIQGYPAPRPSPSTTTGGPACDRKSANMSAGGQTVSETRSTHRRGKPPSRPYSHNQRHYSSKRSQWTSLLSCHSRTALIRYSPSPTTTARRQPFLSRVTKPSRPKEWWSFTSNMCSNGLDSHRRSSVTTTHGWPESSPGRCAPRWESPRTCQPRSTLGRTGSRNAPTKAWSNTYSSTSTPSKATGHNSYQSLSLPITRGKTKALANCHLTF
jgi:hypothetical protein